MPIGNFTALADFTHLAVPTINGFEVLGDGETAGLHSTQGLKDKWALQSTQAQ